MGEVSGDVHGEHLVQELMRLLPGCKCAGIGGERMRQAGLKTVVRSEELSLMGLTEVLIHVPRILGLLGRVKKALRRFKPHAVVVMDCPDFHFFVVRMAKKLGLPVVYYIAPQAWAWRQGRVRFLRKYVDRLLCIFPFEEEFFRRHKVRAEFIGHPLAEEIDRGEYASIAPDPRMIGILPGSRTREVRSLLPEFALTASRLFRRFPDLRFRIVRAAGIDQELIDGIWPEHVPVEICAAEDRYARIRECSFVLAASGTVTLECALLGTPALVAYRVSALTACVGRLLIHVPYIAMPNLILGAEVLPEFIQDRARADFMTPRAQEWFERPEELEAVRNRLHALPGLMKRKGSVAGTASVIRDLALKSSKQKEE